MVPISNEGLAMIRTAPRAVLMVGLSVVGMIPGTNVREGVRDGVGVIVGVLVAVGVIVTVAVSVRVGVAVLVGVAVRVGVEVLVGVEVIVGVVVLVGVVVAVGVLAAVIEILLVAAAKAVLPPELVILAVLPAVPLVWSQARKVKVAVPL